MTPGAKRAQEAALAAGHDVVVWPGGEKDSMRAWTRRDQVELAGRSGFVRQAIGSGVPIVPVATVGGWDTAPVLFGVVDPVRVVPDVDRVQQLEPDLGWERQVDREDLYRDSPNGGASTTGHISARSSRLPPSRRASQPPSDISHAGLRLLLREEGVSFQVIKTWKRSTDPDYEAKKNRVLQLYAIADGHDTRRRVIRRWCFASTSSARSTCNRIRASSGPPAAALISRAGGRLPATPARTGCATCSPATT